MTPMIALLVICNLILKKDMKTLFFVILCSSMAKYTIGQDLFIQKGNKAIAEKNYVLAEEIYRDAIQSDTSRLDYQNQLALSLLKQEKHGEAQIILDKILLLDSVNVAASWYSGINYWTNLKGDLRKAVFYFERVLPFFDEKHGQYFSANWFIGKAYRRLWKSEGLYFHEVSRMIECYSKYLELQPNAKDAREISEYIEYIKSVRPSDNVEKWMHIGG
jgi:tetratricopeptide (TPR) repeat protein